MTALYTDVFFVLAHRMLKRDEDERRFAYDDKTGSDVRKLPSGGNLSIGIGRNLAAKGLRPDEILLVFRNDLEEALEAAHRIFPDFHCYSENRRLGIVNLIFNMGEGNASSGFREFDETIEHMKAGRWQNAAGNLERTLWFRQVKQRGPRVVALIGDDRYDY